jgi:predicted HAD superfamily Cof-like phosphohydrolase
MRTELKLIKEFNKKFHIYDPGKPSVEVDPEYRDLRIRLMQEELAELIKGMQEKDLENIAKESADLLYVLFGTISAYGLLEKFPAIFKEVHESNMSKTYIKGQGKPAKLAGYKKADITKIIKSN